MKDGHLQVGLGHENLKRSLFAAICRLKAGKRAGSPVSMYESSPVAEFIIDSVRLELKPALKCQLRGGGGGGVFNI